MAEVLFRARLVREDASHPWGFRLQGGADYNKPLTLLKVAAGSIAGKCGLQAGDIVVRLAGAAADAMTHRDAQHAIVSAGNVIEILVERCEDDGESISPASSSDEEECEDIMYADLAPPATPQPNSNLKKAILSEGSVQQPLEVQPVISQPIESAVSPTQAPPTQAPPTQAPPTQSPPTQAPPTQAPPTQAPPTQAPPTQTPPTQATPTQSPPIQAPPTQAPPTQAPPTQVDDASPVSTVTTNHVNIPAPAKPSDSSAQSITVGKQVDQNSNTVMAPTDSTLPNTMDNNNLLLKVSPQQQDLSNGDVSSMLPSSSSQSSSVQGNQLLNTTSDVKDTAVICDTVPEQSTAEVVPSEESSTVAHDTVVSDTAAHDTAVTDTVVSYTVVSDTAAHDTVVSDTVAAVTFTPVQTDVVMTPVLDEYLPASVPWRKARRSSAQTSPPVIVARDNAAASDSESAAASSLSSLSVVTAGKTSPGIRSSCGYESDTTQYSKTAPWRVGKGASSSQSSSSSSMPSSELSPQWRLVAKDEERRKAKPPMQPQTQPRTQTTQMQPARSTHSRSVSLPVQHFHSSDPGQLHSYDSIQEESELPKATKASDIAIGIGSQSTTVHQTHQTPISVVAADPKIKPSLTFVGKRIESPVSSPVTKGMPFFKPPMDTTSKSSSLDSTQTIGKAYYPPPPGSGPKPLPLPTVELEAITSKIGKKMPQPSELKELRKTTNAEFHPLKAEDIMFSSADPDLMGLSMPAVKEMVNDLNRRLEAIAVQHPRIAVKEDLGTVFTHKKDQDSRQEEIFIDSAPMSDNELYAPPFSTENLSPRSAQRRVHFAEPVESSVIEIESQSRRRISRDNKPQQQQPPQYSSAKSLAATLDRIERENAMSSMQFRNTVGNVSTPTPTQTPTSTLTQTLTQTPTTISISPSTTPTDNPKRVPVSVVHTSTHDNKPGVAFKSSDKGFSFSIGKGPPGHQINVSMLQQSPGGEPTRLAFHIPPSAPGGPRQFTYSFHRPEGPKAPFRVTYDLPPSYEESIRSSQQRAAQMISPPPPPQPNMSPVHFLDTSPRLSPQPQHYHQRHSPTPPLQHYSLAPPQSGLKMAQAGLYPHPDPSKPLHIQTAVPPHPQHYSPQPQQHPQQQQHQHQHQQHHHQHQQHQHQHHQHQHQQPHPHSQPQPQPFLDDDQLTQSRSFRLLEARFNNTPAAAASSMAHHPQHSHPPPHPPQHPQQHHHLHPSLHYPPPPPQGLHHPSGGLGSSFPRRASEPSPLGDLSSPAYHHLLQHSPHLQHHLPGHPRQVAQPAATARPYMPPAGPGPGPGAAGPGAAGPGAGPGGVPAMRAYLPGPESPVDLYSYPTAVKDFENMPGLFCLFDKDFTDKFMTWQSDVSGGFRQSETAKLVQEMDEENKYGQNL